MDNNRYFYHLCADEVAELRQNPDLQILDVRSKSSYDQGHIETARYVTDSDIDRIIMTSPKHHPVLIYCYRGVASLTHAQTFADFGFKEVYSLNGGYEGWKLMQAASQNNASSAPRVNERLRAWLSGQGFPADNIHSTLAGDTTPLMRACQLADAAIVAELLVTGADLDARNSDGNHALWFACYSNSLDIIELLIAAGISVDNQNDNGATCLMYAASSGKDEVVAKLLQAGVNTALKTLDDFTALDMAASMTSLKLLRSHGSRI